MLFLAYSQQLIVVLLVSSVVAEMIVLDLILLFIQVHLALQDNVPQVRTVLQVLRLSPLVKHQSINQQLKMVFVNDVLQDFSVLVNLLTNSNALQDGTVL